MPNIQQVQSGQMPLARDWNALADRYNAGAIGLSGYDVRRRLLATGLVVVKNVSGSDRSRFDCMSLGDTTLTIDDDAETDVIFEADTAAGDETPVILQEPIANNQFGLGCIFGYTLAKLEQASAASDVYGTPNGTNHNLDCGSTETTIKILSAPSTSADSLRPVLIGGTSGSGSAKIALATGGVSARSGTTVGSGTVTEYKLSGSTLTTNTDTFTAYNLDAKAIPSGQYVLCVQESITSQWIVQHPGIIGLRLSGNDLQYTFDGTTWVTWTTATTCA